MEKVKINGVVYRYIITDENSIKVKGIVSHNEYEAIKERLIKRGKYQENRKETIKVKYNENYLKRRFQNWSKVELRLYLEELEEKMKKNSITNEEKLVVQPIREELERRSKEN